MRGCQSRISLRHLPALTLSVTRQSDDEILAELGTNVLSSYRVRAMDVEMKLQREVRAGRIKIQIDESFDDGHGGISSSHVVIERNLGRATLSLDNRDRCGRIPGILGFAKDGMSLQRVASVLSTLHCDAMF